MKEFINEFKVYCETIEDTKGLEIIKENLGFKTLNLETFIEDYLDKDNDEVKEARRLSDLLIKLSAEYKKISNLEVREIYKYIRKLNKYDANEMLEWVLTDCCDFLTNKYNPNNEWGDISSLEDNQLEKWYIDLYNLFEKYSIG